MCFDSYKYPISFENPFSKCNCLLKLASELVFYFRRFHFEHIRCDVFHVVYILTGTAECFCEILMLLFFRWIYLDKWLFHHIYRCLICARIEPYNIELIFDTYANRLRFFQQQKKEEVVASRIVDGRMT